MLKVYKYCLGIVFIIDTGKNTMHTAYLHDLLKNKKDYNQKKITKATVNKHIKDRGYVISPAILENYAPEECSSDTSRIFLGEFTDMEELSAFAQNLCEKTKCVRDQYNFSNFGADLWDIVNALRHSKTEEEYNKFNLKPKNEMALFREIVRLGGI